MLSVIASSDEGVTPPEISIAPTSAMRGRTTLITVTGTNTNFVNGVTAASVSGTGVTVLSTNVTSPTAATVQVNLTADATLGFRDFTMTTVGEVASVPAGLLIVEETASQLIVNGGFELAPSSGNEASGWGVFPSPGSGHQLISKNGLPVHAGTACAVLGGTDLTQYDTLIQYVTIPDDVTAANLTFWTRISTEETAGHGAYDFLWVVLHDSDGNEIATPVELSNEDATPSYFRIAPVDLSAYAGRPIRISFVAYTDNVFETRFLIDDVALVAVRPVTGPRPRVTAPAAGAVLSGTVTVSAVATPNGSAISSLSIEIDGVQKASTSGASLSYSWDTTQFGNGQHTIVAKARDLAGHEAFSPAVTVTTSNLLAPRNVVAIATSAANVSVTWDAVDTASSYQIFRRTDGGPYELAGTSLSNSFVHSGLPANAAFIYQVRAVDASGIAGPPSAGDLATTIRFVDDPLLIRLTTIKAVHVTQLRTAVNAVRAAAGLPAVTFSGTVARGSATRAVHVMELRISLDAARAAAGLPAMNWGSIVNAGTVILANHLQKLREGVE
jgi:hypothetical protein